MSSSIKQMYDSLNKWNKVCTAMNCNEDIIIIADIKKVLANNKLSIKDKKDETIEVKVAINAFSNKRWEELEEMKLLFIKKNINIINEWEKLSEQNKSKLTKKELNIIYYILYKNTEVKFIKKNKKEIIHDINYYVYNNKRNRALKESELI